MHNLITKAMVGAILLGATAANAGGPVIIEDEMEVVAEKPASAAAMSADQLGLDAADDAGMPHCAGAFG